VNFGTGPKRSSSILDSTNPLDLMNKLRRGTALDIATPPGDAVDAALKDFQVQSAPGQRQSSPLPPGRISASQPSAGQLYADKLTDQKSAGQQQPAKTSSQITQ
jgi:hypothetical protein